MDSDNLTEMELEMLERAGWPAESEYSQEFNQGGGE